MKVSNVQVRIINAIMGETVAAHLCPGLMQVFHCSYWTAPLHQWRFDEMIHSKVQGPVK